ncbi:MAG: hypothetical protein AAF360_08360 [Pseudomonadota bacterium]
MATGGKYGRGGDGEGARVATTPIRWAHFVLAQIASVACLSAAGFFIDTALIGLGVRLALRIEVLILAAYGFLLSAPLAFVIWRLGIVKLPQYLLAALAIFPPAAIAISAASAHFGVVIAPPVGYPWSDADHIMAFDMSARLIRAGFLSPLYMLMFWIVYQRCLAPDPDQ